MEFVLLGGVRASHAGYPINLGVRKQRLVLAVLALEVNHPLTIERLVELIWGPGPPATARGMIHTYISCLRTTLSIADASAAGVRLDSTRSGYRLRCDPARIDVHRFRALVAEAHQAAGDAERVRILDRALALWRGPALAGVAGEAVRARLCRPLDEVRLAAVEDRMEARLRLGEHGQLLDELLVLTGEHPDRPRLAAGLMQALQGLGRTAEALQAYDRVQRRLRDEFGLDPPPELQRVHVAVLRGDASPPVPTGAVARPVRAAPPPALLPAAPATFAGRAAKVDRLHALLPDPRTVVIAAIDGMAGVGKTCLAVHWAHQVAYRFPDGQLYVDLGGFGPARSAVEPAEALRDFLDAFGVPPQQVPTSLAGRVARYRSLLAGQRVLVILDNARSAEQVRPLLPGTPGCAVVVTSRNRLTGLVAADGAHPVTLDVLSPAEARQLLAARLGADRLAAEPQAADDIAAACAGLPLALAVVAARAASFPDFPLAALAKELTDASGTLDAFASEHPATDLRTVFSWSHRTLSPAAAGLFRLLGAHPGAVVTVATAAGLAGVPVARARPLLVELARAHLVAESAPGQYALHALSRAYAAELAGQA